MGNYIRIQRENDKCLSGLKEKNEDARPMLEPQRN